MVLEHQQGNDIAGGFGKPADLNHDLATLGALVGFVVMMVLDVAFR